ncbi:MAG: heme ABC exporter ATP-binding protein CcmA [Burkholderiaceae bacterium]
MGARLNREYTMDRSGWQLQARGVACERGERRLFADFDFALAAGDIVWLRAANGFGKTSLMRVIAGLAQPAAGTIEWREPRPSLLYLAHANALKDDLTIIESLRHLSRLHGLEASDAALTEAMRRFGLQARRHAPIRTLSQGQRRRVALMRLCLSPPRAVWLLDEPYDALDNDGSVLVSSLLAEHARRGGSVLLTSHVGPEIPGIAVQSIQLDARPDAQLDARSVEQHIA